MLPPRTMVIAEIGTELDPYWWARTQDGWSIEVEPGEQVLISENCQVRIDDRKLRVTLPETTYFLLTDRRIAWATRDYLRSGGYFGYTVGGAVTAAAINVVSHRRVAKKTAGKAAAGQVRFEWLDAIWVHRKKSLSGHIDWYVNFLVPCSEKPERIELWSRASQDGRLIDDEFARWVALLALERRAVLDPRIRAACDEQGERIRARHSDASTTLKDGDLGWTFPGEVVALIENAVAASVSVPLGDNPTERDLHCPWCGEALELVASRCRHCSRTVQPIPAPSVRPSAPPTPPTPPTVRVAEKREATVAGRSQPAADIEDCFDFAGVRDLDRALRRRLRIALESARSLPRGEALVGVVPVTADSIPGLLALSDERILFIDEVTGLLDIAFDRARATASKHGGSVTIRDDDGETTFVRLSAARAAGAPAPTRKGGVPSVRVCGDCGAEFTPAYLGDDCPDCGGALGPSED